MTMTCTMCRHPDRASIDLAIVQKTGAQEIATRYDALSHDAIRRHRLNCLPRLLAAGYEALEEHEREEVKKAIDGLRQLQQINSEVWGVLERAKESSDDPLILAASDRVMKQIEHQARLTGEIDTRPVVTNILLAPTLYQTIVAALEPYPDARYAVAQALKELEE
jgi:hypothetical protein